MYQKIEEGNKMSMPKFPSVPDGYTINDSIAQILTSVAMEEIGLSHIINAEGEKMQYVLGTLEGQQQLPDAPTFEQILEMNDSVKDMLGQVSFSQMFLMGKMQAALNAYQDIPTPTPPTPIPGIDNIFAAAGTGEHIQQVPVRNMVVPFGQTYMQVGSNFVYDFGGNYFQALTAGEYQINYQVAVNEPYGDGTQPINMTGRLEKTLNAPTADTYDTFTFPQTPFTLVQRNITVNLNVGDRVQLDIINNGTDDTGIEVLSQSIIFVRVG